MVTSGPNCCQDLFLILRLEETIQRLPKCKEAGAFARGPISTVPTILEEISAFSRGTEKVEGNYRPESEDDRGGCRLMADIRFAIAIHESSIRTRSTSLRLFRISSLFGEFNAPHWTVEAGSERRGSGQR
jgi:hypothetical protein